MADDDIAESLIDRLLLALAAQLGTSENPALGSMEIKDAAGVRVAIAGVISVGGYTMLRGDEEFWRWAGVVDRRLAKFEGRWVVLHDGFFGFDLGEQLRIGGRMLKRVSREEEDTLREIALAVAADLQFIGLVVVQAGDCWTGSTNFAEGYVVYYDPDARLDAGCVYARWKPSIASIRAKPASPDSEAFLATAIDEAVFAMSKALRRILEAAGWQVEEVPTYEHPALKISRKPGSPSLSTSISP
ncbi:hypothetical protein Ait01nite_088090 [Actinoplanes italicus]|uniref:Uncharacterized protein n=1 Tax=Actinoplanes italicus TaxID=113567 RepID=A0A2T0K4F2_9ACTN|nr:hypothetical protein [Actinoplanes italicus]PRX17757.1 hypothetical protein CLV67_115260 [Actinoplanes italicus]GIE35764.1 hypothetical protein Ait01nite_088090 [Actinoplanes italicus]